MFPGGLFRQELGSGRIGCSRRWARKRREGAAGAPEQRLGSAQNLQRSAAGRSLVQARSRGRGGGCEGSKAPVLD